MLRLGIAYILISLIIVFTIIPIVYIVGGYIVSKIYVSVDTSDIVTPQSRNIINYLLMIWDYWPVLAVIVGIIWAIVVSQKREPWYDEE